MPAAASPVSRGSSLPAVSSVALFQRVYLFAVDRMSKSRYEAEQFANGWVQRHSSTDFAAFEAAYAFAVDKMSKSRYEAEQFAFRRIRGEVLE